jgi:DNA-binding protein H-NS
METMTKTYASILKQIEALQQDAERVRQKEIAGVVGRIRDAIDAYKLTAEDLGFVGSFAGTAGKKAAVTAALPYTGKRRGPKPKANKGVKAQRVVKYRNDSGGTWGGLGKRPDWLRAALAGGKQLSDFAVK